MRVWSCQTAPALDLSLVEPFEPPQPRVIWSVASLVHAVADALAARFSACTVAGELSGFTRASSGHCYFTLKDGNGESASLRCAMFKRAGGLLQFLPADGQQVQLRGRLGVYEPRGELQFIVESMQRSGEGALYEKFMLLKRKLEQQGLFDESRKRAIPPWPRRVGVVTSLDAAALHDVTSSFARRLPHVELIIYPSPVQGAPAPDALVAAIVSAGTRREVDILLVCRGGGSIEDLWAFNDERVVRAVADCPIPVISGVGHETDVTLVDFAADLRAPTPTAAAELCARSARDAAADLARVAAAMQRRVRQALDTQAQRVDSVAVRLLRPAEALHRHTRVLDTHSYRLVAAAHRALNAAHQDLRALSEGLKRATVGSLQVATHRIDRLGERLRGVDPDVVLKRGYAWLLDDDGRALTSARQLSVGQALRAVLSDGEAVARVTEVTPRE
jgi:exodeoxyribonuclease VII large subunit